MPKNPIDYCKSLIYKIACNDPTITDIYVGSTTNFVKRKARHKFDCCNPNSPSHDYYVYQFIRANGGWDNWRMELIEYYACNTNLELERREGQHIIELKASLNKKVAGRTKQEWYEANKDKQLEKVKLYYQKNRDKQLEKKKLYYQKRKNNLGKK